MKLVIPYQTPFLATKSGPDITGGVFAATDFWWTLEDKYPLAKMFVEAFDKKYGYKPEWGANNAYMQFAIWADAVEHAGSFYPPDVIKSYEAGRKIPVDRRRGLFPRRRSSAGAAGDHRARQDARRR